MDTRFDRSYRFKCGVDLRNAYVLAPLDMRLALFDGTVSQNDVAFHQSHAGSVGMDIVGSAFVQKNGRTRVGALSVADDETIPGLHRLAETIHQQGSRAILQLSHAGIRAQPEFGQGLVGPSERYQVASMSNEQIVRLVTAFAQATKRAYQAGFDGIELQGGNRFLLQQFLSPLINHRTDRFGGTLERRLRVPLLVVKTVLQVARQWPRPFIVGYRLSPEERQTGGLTVTDTLVLARLLERLGIDYLSLSLHHYGQGAVTYDQITPIVQLFTRELTDLPVMVAGGIQDTEDLRMLNGVALVALGRQLILNPEWPQEKRPLNAAETQQRLGQMASILSETVRHQLC